MTILGIPSEVWLPLISLILGIILKGVFDALADRRTLQREREARSEQTSDTLRLKRIEFQRETLLELQETATQMARDTANIYYHQMMASKESGDWKYELLDEALDERSRETRAKFHQLRVRVQDEKTRHMAKIFAKGCSSVVMAQSQQEAEAALKELSNRDFQEQIGTVLRSLDSAEDQIIDE